MQQPFEFLQRRPATKQIVAYLTDTKTTSLENTMELVYPSGGAGNVYIGGGLKLGIGHPIQEWIEKLKVFKIGKVFKG